MVAIYSILFQDIFINFTGLIFIKNYCVVMLNTKNMDCSNSINRQQLGQINLRSKFLYTLVRCMLLAVIFIASSGLSLKAQSYNIDDYSGQTVMVQPGTPAYFYDSGGSDRDYKEREDYTITFSSAYGTPLKVSFTAFRIEDNYDKLYIYNGTSTSSELIGTYSGNTSPGEISVSGGSLTFRFTSDRSNNYSGWAATITTVNPVENDPITTCSATFTDLQGNANYLTNQYYKVTYISGEAGKNVRLDFTDFSLGSGDYLRIIDGDSIDSPVLGTYTGTGTPGTVLSTGSTLSAIFYSDASGVSSGWSADVSCFAATTYYSYTNGAWNNYATWTTDPSGTRYVNDAKTFPSSLDKAVILNGKTVSANGNNSVTQLEIQEGAILDVGTTTGNNFGTVQGKGTLRSVSAVLPSGVYTLFTQSGGGTIELYGNTSGNLSLATVNNLTINANSGYSAYITQSPTQLNGNLAINSGTLRINSSINMTVEGDITVASGARFNASSGVSNLYAKGDFENAGTVTFTSKTYAGYTQDAWTYVALYFTNTAQDQSFVCNGTTNLEKLIVDKGVDDTYTLNVTASNTGNFNLWGSNNATAEDIDTPTILKNNKALDIIAGTLYLGSNIEIPRLFSYYNTERTNYYAINQSATLILDGANVVVAEQFSNSSIVVYGKLKVIGNSTFESLDYQGIILREYGVFEIGGTATVNTTVVRTSSRLELGTHRGTFIMSGGTLNISGYNYATSHASFALPFPDNTFQMSGGVINISNPSYYGSITSNESWLVSSSADNISVTGGTVNISSASSNARLNSTAPFYNLNIIGSTNRTVSIEAVTPKKDGGNTVVPAADRRPLVVLNNLSIAASTTFNPQAMDVTVGGDFTINGIYTPGENTTTFDGLSLQKLDNVGTITSGLYNMVLQNKSVLSVTRNLTVLNDLEINAATTLKDAGKTIAVAGNIVNSGTHESETGGSIQLNGTGDQTIDGSGAGVFGNLSLNKASGTSTLNCNIGLTGDLRLGGTSSVFNIGANKLSLSSGSNIYSALSGTGANFTSTRMVQTNGLVSDLGIEKEWATTGSFTYPIGVSGKYTPAVFELYAEPTTWGKLAVNPVNGRHPLATSTNGLNYYWNVRSTGMEGLSSGSSTLDFYYHDDDIAGTESSYKAAHYYPPVWTMFETATSPVTTSTNQIRFNEIANIRGHFTAGEGEAFGEVKTYYSKVSSGDWDTPASWTTDLATEANATEKPGTYSPVIIRNGHTINVSTNAQTVGSLTIQQGAVLDLKTTTGHSFGMVTDSKGTLRISSATATASFPSGDFGEFLGENGGTVEYYTTGVQDYNMPSTSVTASNKEVILFSNGFESGNFSAWNSSRNWEIIEYPYSGNYSARCSNKSQINRLGIPAIDLSGAISCVLKYKMYHRYFSYYETYAIYTSTDGNNYTKLQDVNAGSNSWSEVTVDLSSFAGTSALYVAIGYKAGEYSTWRNTYTSTLYIDDVEISAVVEDRTSNYHNLIINPSASRTITMPAEDVEVSGNLTVNGAGVASTSASFGATLTVEGTTSVKETGKFSISNGAPITLVQKDSLIVDSGAQFIVAASGNAVANVINLYGDVVNNGTINLNPDGTRYADLYFLGTNNQTFSGTGSAGNFYRVYVNKGTSQTPMVDITASKFDMSSSLTQPFFLLNGTARFTGAALTPILTRNSSFRIPSTACLSVNGSTVMVCNGNSDAYDLMLSGKIEVKAGTLNVGNLSNTVNNDIEYPAAGIPQIEVSGGVLNVNGQVRRSVTNANGSLQYTQSGGEVNIFGKNREVKRPLFDILNDGEFNMSDGTLTLVQGVASSLTTNTFGELYLNPATYNVTGGTIVTGSSQTDAAKNYFNLFLACPIYNFTIDGTTNAKIARLKTYEATFKGSILIDGPSSSQLLANGINMNVAGDFISRSGNRYGSFNYGSLTQKITFNGQNQSVYHDNTYVALGGLNFAEVCVDLLNNGTLTHVKGEFWARGDLNLLNGNLVQDAGNFLVMKNLYLKNGFTHISNGYSVITIYNSSLLQYIYTDGTGSLGRLRLYHDKDVTVEGDLLINNGIQFSPAGAVARLNIGDSRLTFGPNATIGTGTSAPNSSRYIITNGALSDGGVTKEFSATNNQSFTFPVGVGNSGGKYTPATIKVTNTGGSAGSITVKPVDAPHPACTNTTTDEQLQYFWNVESEGFGTSPTFNQTYTYVEDDVKGDESAYFAARYNDKSFIWTSGTTDVGTVDVDNNTINITNKSFIDGEYTAGERENSSNEPNFGNVEIFYSKTNGNWESTSTWECALPTAPETFYPATKIPSGNPVFIRAGHTVTTTANYGYASSVDIAATAKLDLKSTLYHNLGHITGGGTLAMTSIPSTDTYNGSFKFPGGNALVFLSTSGSKVEYTGSGTIPANITSYMNVSFLGASSKKAIPAIDITVNENMTIDGGILDDLNSQTMTVKGNWIDNVSGGFVPNKGTVVFAGGVTQTLTAIGGENFYNLRINKSAEVVTLNSPATVSRVLTLSSGVIATDATNILTVSYSAINSVVGGSTTSYVDGPLRRKVNSSSYANFPVGDGGRFGNLYIFQTTTSGEQYWIGEYVNAQPADNTNFVDPIRSLSDNEYWKLTGVDGAKANVRIRWDSASGSIIEADLDKLRIAQYLPPWTAVGETVSQSAQTVSTSTPIVFDGGAEQFTLALEETASAKITSTDVAECNDGTNFVVTYTVTGDAPLRVAFTVNGSTFRSVTGLTSGSHSLTLTYADLFAINGAGDYVVAISEVRDANSRAGIVQGTTVTLTAKATPSPIISGANSVMTSSTVNYSVASVAGNTYSWSVDANGSVDAGYSTTNPTSITWGASAGNATISVTETNPTTSCFTGATYDVVIRDWPVIVGNSSPCANSAETYSSKQISGHTYSWAVEGGTIQGVQGTYQIAVLWSSQTAGRITLVQGPSGNTQTITQQVVINPAPVATIVAVNDTICSGDYVTLTLGGTQMGADYTFYLERENAGSWDAVSNVTTLGNVDINSAHTWQGPNANYIYTYRVMLRNNTTGCGSLYVEEEIVVYKIPETGPQYHIPNN